LPKVGKTARRYRTTATRSPTAGRPGGVNYPAIPVGRTIRIQAGNHIITAADPLPDELRGAIDAINNNR
jgi:hypothetical protein